LSEKPPNWSAAKRQLLSQGEAHGRPIAPSSAPVPHAALGLYAIRVRKKSVLRALKMRAGAKGVCLPGNREAIVRDQNLPRTQIPDSLASLDFRNDIKPMTNPKTHPK
jgi:hypothetical protein